MGKIDSLVRAQSLRASGRLAEAEALYREVLQARPDEGEALEGLGLLAQSWNVQGDLARDQKRHSDAAAAYREAIRLSPQFVPGHIKLGIVLLAQHRRDEAALALRAALGIEPGNLLAITKLGQALCELRDPDMVDEAETHCRRALALSPDVPEVLENLGQVLRQKGCFPEALECYKQGLKVAPSSVSIRLSMAELLLASGRYDGAVRLTREALTLDPNDARLHTQMGSMSFARQRYEDAAAQYRAAVALDAGLAEAHHGLGLALHEQGLLDQAECSYREAIHIDSTFAPPWVALARLQAERGDRDESCRTARGILALRPNVADAYWRLAVNLNGALSDCDILEMQRLLEHKYVSHGLRAGLHFGLGAVFDARGLYARAAEHFEAANGLQTAVAAAKGRSFDPDQYSRMIDRLIAAFSPALLARGRGWGDPDPRPVFVVGLPRSGTTLVEQIAASHSQVHGAGELRDANHLFTALPEFLGRPGGDPFEVLSALGPDSARAVASKYLATLDRLAPATASRVVDKMPDNFNLLGLIALLWPKARVIYCSRDLRDIALSCWQTSFATNPWTNDWDHIARRFADHERLLAHWRQTKPIDWLEVVYEELVCDLEGHARRLIAFLGLQWEPACLDFHKTRRVVRTASQLQVREPIHSRSVGRWRKYESALQPLIESLHAKGAAGARSESAGPG